MLLALLASYFERESVEKTVSRDERRYSDSDVTKHFTAA